MCALRCVCVPLIMCFQCFSVCLQRQAVDLSLGAHGANTAPHHLFVGTLHCQTGTGPFVLLNIIEMCSFATLSRKQMGWQCYNWIPLCPGQTFKKIGLHHALATTSKVTFQKCQIGLVCFDVFVYWHFLWWNCLLLQFLVAVRCGAVRSVLLG